MRALVVVALLLAAPGIMAVEEPEYTLLAETPDYEVRRYGPTVVAELVVESSFEQAGNDAFRPLAKFISGANEDEARVSMTAPVTQRREGAKIAMTAPVTQRESGDGRYAVRFVMPSQYTLDTVPRPTDPRIQLSEEPGRVVAVHRYTGSWSESRYREREAQLVAALERDGIEPAGEAVWARFNSPFQLWFLRRNEIWLPVEWPDAEASPPQ